MLTVPSCVYIFFSFYLLNFLYIRLFTFLVKQDIVPTGAGIIFSFILFISSFSLYYTDGINFACLVTIFLASLLYWLDDLFSLTPIHRMLIAISTSSILFCLLSSPLIFPLLILLLSLTVMMMIFLVNVLNFYDGADLNLISLFFFLGLILLIFDRSNVPIVSTLGFFLIIYSFSFAIFNYRPKVLYLGDCGSFVLASIVIYMFITAIFGIISWPAQTIPLLAFPAFDVVYVLAIRFHLRHDFLSRNYLHLYQRLDILYKNYFYLLPCAVNVLLSVLLISFLSLFVNQILITSSVVTLIVTPCTYFYFRYRYVEPSFFFGDGSKNG